MDTRLTFKEFLAEIQMDPEATPAEAAAQQRKYQQNPRRASRIEAQKQQDEARMAQKDPDADPQMKRIEKQEAILARQKAAMVQKQQQQGQEQQGM